MKRFEEKYKEIENGCWIWKKLTKTHRYGNFYFNGKSQQSHRVSWQLHFGEIPEGMKVLHKCDTPGCVNPEHLFLGTQKDNVLDCIKKGRFHQNSAKSCEKHHFAKLKAVDVQNIKAIYKYTDATHQKLANIYGVSREQIGKIIRGERWQAT